MGLEAPLRERGSASAGRHSDLSPFSSHLLGVSWALGRDSVRALGQSPRGRAGGQLPRDDVTSVTAATLKISAATAGLLPCLLCPGLAVPADVGPGPAGDSALVPTAAVLSRLRPPSPRGGVPAGEGWRGGRVAEGPWGQRPPSSGLAKLPGSPGRGGCRRAELLTASRRGWCQAGAPVTLWTRRQDRRAPSICWGVGVQSVPTPLFVPPASDGCGEVGDLGLVQSPALGAGAGTEGCEADREESVSSVDTCLRDSSPGPWGRGPDL